jgi:phycoerythrin-associated linker protein
MLQLLQSNSSSDKNLATNNQPQLVRSLITNTPYGKLKPTDVSAILAEVFKPKPESASAPVSRFIPAYTAAEQDLRQKIEPPHRIGGWGFLTSRDDSGTFKYPSRPSN